MYEMFNDSHRHLHRLQDEILLMIFAMRTEAKCEIAKAVAIVGCPCCPVQVSRRPDRVGKFIVNKSNLGRTSVHISQPRPVRAIRLYRSTLSLKHLVDRRLWYRTHMEVISVKLWMDYTVISSSKSSESEVVDFLVEKSYYV